MTPEEELLKYLLENSESLDPDIVKFVNENFWKLLE